jgi:hypothetical protein
MLPIESVASMSRAVAADTDQRLNVVGVASSGGDTGRVELLVTVDRSREDPSMIMVNVTRSGRDALERDLRDKFRDALSR